MRWLVLTALFLVPVQSFADKQGFNEDGETLYSLLRVDEAYPDPDRIHHRVANLLAYLEKLLDPAEYRRTKSLVENTEGILCNQTLQDLYNVFLAGVRYSAVRPIKPKNDEEATFSLKGKFAGNTHLRIMDGFEAYLKSNPDFTYLGAADLFVTFDDYLVAHGVEGFGAYAGQAQFTARSSSRKHTLTDLFQNLKMARSGILVGALGCATLLGGWQYFNRAVDLPADRLHPQTQQQTFQEKADQSAHQVGKHALDKMLHPPKP